MNNEYRKERPEELIVKIAIVLFGGFILIALWKFIIAPLFGIGGDYG